MALLVMEDQVAVVVTVLHGEKIASQQYTF
jgi:hypothetical protein